MRALFAIWAALIALAGYGNRVAPAADFEVFSVSQQSIGESRLEAPRAGTAEEDLTFAITTRDAKVVLPLSFADGDTVLLNTLSANRFIVEIGNLPIPDVPEFVQHFYGRSYSLTVVQKLSPGYRATLIASIGRFADRDPPQADDQRTTVGLILHRVFSENFSLGIGAIQTSDSGEPQLVPALQYQYKGEVLRINASLPQGLDVRLVPGGTLQYGANARVQGNQYRVTQSDRIDALKYSVGTAGLYVILGGEAGPRLTLSGGTTFRRRYDTLLGETEVRSVDLEDNTYVEATVGLVF